MNELQSALAALCTELAVTLPEPQSSGRYDLRIGDNLVRIGPWGPGEVVLEGVIVSLGENVASRWETQQDLLRQMLTWNIARLKGQARPEVLSFDEAENLLLLWRTWPCDDRLTARLLRGTEEMLNELDFWRSKVTAIAPSIGARPASP